MMKKSLTKLLARMARDGDAETVAEFIEALTEGEAPALAGLAPEETAAPA